MDRDRPAGTRIISARGRVAPLYGFLHGFVFYPICLPWIDVGDAAVWQCRIRGLRRGILALIGIAGGMICAFFPGAWRWPRARSATVGVRARAFLWVTIEFARAHLPILRLSLESRGLCREQQSGARAAHHGDRNLRAEFRRSRPTDRSLAYAVLSAGSARGRQCCVATAALIFVAVGGRYLVPSAHAAFHVAHLVQTNFAQSYDYPADWMQTHAGDLDALEKISVDAARSRAGPDRLARSARAIQHGGSALRRARTANRARFRRRFSGRRRGLEARRGGEVLRDEQRRAARSHGPADLHLRQDSSRSLRRICPAAPLDRFRRQADRRYRRFHAGHRIRCRQHSDGAGVSSGGTFGVFICYEAIFPERCAGSRQTAPNC